LSGDFQQQIMFNSVEWFSMLAVSRSGLLSPFFHWLNWNWSTGGRDRGNTFQVSRMALRGRSFSNQTPTGTTLAFKITENALCADVVLLVATLQPLAGRFHFAVAF
jgi:hypothetical protein